MDFPSHPYYPPVNDFLQNLIANIKQRLADEKDNVTVNPAMLPEIQNLINREPGEFWSTITGVPSAAQQ